MTDTMEKARTVIVYCKRNGVIVFGSEVPRNAITLAQGNESHLRRLISALGRLSYDNQTFLVPGVPEARDDDAANQAVWEFQERLQLRLAEEEGA